MESSSSSSSSPPVVPQHCSTVPVLYELLKCEEEPCRMWLRAEMSQIADPLIDSIFHGLIMSSSSSSSAVSQSRLTVSELCELLEREKVESSKVLKGEMDRLLNTLFERLTNKLRMTNTETIHIKREHFDDQSDNEQQINAEPVESFVVPLDQFNPNDFAPLLDNRDPSTNVNLNIKTEPMECDLVVVKEEIIEEDEEEGNDIFIKREYVSSYIKTESSDEEVEEEIKEEIKEEYEDDHDDCGFVRCVVKKEEVSDDDEVDNEGGLIRGGDNDEVDDERYEVTQPNVDCGQLLSNPSRDRKNDSNANESIEEGGTNLSSQQLLNTANQSDDQTVTQSADLLSPSTSTAQDSSRTALNQQATASTGRNANKRKQPSSIRTEKRSKKTTEDDDDGEDGEDDEDIANEVETKVKVLYLDCSESNCNVKLDSLLHLNDHLRTVHRLSPHQCLATDCNARFDNRGLIREHVKLHNSQSTRFLCPVCHKVYDSQIQANKHWYRNHQTGQFKCNLVGDCAQVTDTRVKMKTHQQTKHYTYSKHFNCTQPGCTASFAFKSLLKQHESTHLDQKPFHCNFPQCSHRTNRRAHLVTHIRMKHFGLPSTMKEQMAKNIVDLRDPYEYVRVVVDDVE